MPITFALKPGLVVYLTIGDPDVDTSREIALAAIDAGADVIELGVPFSDPVADGPVIQRASERALARGTTLKHVLAVAADVRRQRPQAGLVVFSYFNPVLRYGLERFCAAAAEAGVDGMLITDLTVEEADEYVRLAHQYALAPIFLAAPTSPDERLRKIAQASRGFAYAVSRTGITGTQQSLTEDAQTLVRRMRRFTSLPIALGFGVANAEHVQALGEFADAAVIGSAIVSIIERCGEPRSERGSAIREESAAESAGSSAPAAIAEFIRGLRPAAVSAR